MITDIYLMEELRGRQEITSSMVSRAEKARNSFRSYDWTDRLRGYAKQQQFDVLVLRKTVDD